MVILMSMSDLKQEMEKFTMNKIKINSLIEDFSKLLIEKKPSNKKLKHILKMIKKELN